MKFFIKTVCDFLSFSGNLNSLEDVSDEMNDDDQEVQPQTEKKTKAEKKRICTGPAYQNFPRTIYHAWKIRKMTPRIYGKNDTRTKRAGRERKGKRQDIFSQTRQIIY